VGSFEPESLGKVPAVSADQHPDSRASESGASRTGLSTRAKAVIAALTAVVTLATGILTLRDQLSGDDDSSSAREGNPESVADITNDAEAKSRADAVLTGLKRCKMETGRDYQGCNTAGILGALHIPIGSGVGAVQVDVSSAETFVLTSRSESGHTFLLEKTAAEGEEVRTCTPPGAGGCPEDGRW
jgi:hypothetical protein